MNTIPMHVVFGSLALLIVCGGIGCASVPLTDDIPVVKGFEAARYMGTWHEIARLPKWYERDMIHVSAEYSLARIAIALRDAFGLDDVNKLPLAFDIAWYEQKAVAVLLALLALGFRNIRLGPTLPAFLSPSVVRTLVERFGLCGIGNVEDDVRAIMV